MKIKSQVSLIAVASLLVACGGGGGGSGPDTQPSTPATPVPNSVPLQTSIPTPTYPQGSDELAALSYLNKARSDCGFGMLKQNTLLDKAAKNHTAYMAENPYGDPHVETRGLTGFTGTDGTERAGVVGYVNKGPEVLENGYSKWQMRNLDILPPATAPTEFTESVRVLIQAPYHALNGMLSPVTEIGMGQTAKETIQAKNGTQRWQDLLSPTYYEFGYGDSSSGQMPVEGQAIRTYPCEGSSDILPIFINEYSQFPILPDNRGSGGIPPSSAIIIFGEAGKKLELISAKLTQTSNNTDNPVFLMRLKENDTNPIYYRNESSGYIIFDKPLIPFQSYTATINGKSGGQPFTRQFTYKVGNHINQDAINYAIAHGLPTR